MGLKWFGHDATWMREYCEAMTACASGFEFSPQISPLTGPNSEGQVRWLSPPPPVCTRRSLMVGISFWCRPTIVPVRSMNNWVL